MESDALLLKVSAAVRHWTTGRLNTVSSGDKRRVFRTATEAVLSVGKSERSRPWRNVSMSLFFTRQYKIPLIKILILLLLL